MTIGIGGIDTNTMSYSLATLWHERQRYLPGILAVAFSALLIALQCGLLLGLFSITSMPIDHTKADIWMGAPGVLSVDLGRPIPQGYLARLASQPEVAQCEIYLQGFAYWSKPDGGTELCMIVGSRLEDSAMGRVAELTPELREKLTEPGAVVVDESDLHRLGITGVGDTAEISGYRVRVVGLTRGLKSLAGPYVFCSIRTARPRLRQLPNQTTYVLARCHNPADAPKVVNHLRERYDNISAFTADEFSLRSRMHWLTKTKAGIALGYAAALGLLVGAVVTSQTLYAATAASLREFAVLRALGIPRWRMGLMVMTQSFWVGIIGVGLSIPAVFALAELADRLGVKVDLRWWLLTGAALVTLTMALLSGLYALRSLRHVEPAMLLR
jgi:putative ABC transport system permease protein